MVDGSAQQRSTGWLLNFVVYPVCNRIPSVALLIPHQLPTPSQFLHEILESGVCSISLEVLCCSNPISVCAFDLRLVMSIVVFAGYTSTI